MDIESDFTFFGFSWNLLCFVTFSYNCFCWILVLINNGSNDFDFSILLKLVFIFQFYLSWFLLLKVSTLFGCLWQGRFERG